MLHRYCSLVLAHHVIFFLSLSFILIACNFAAKAGVITGALGLKKSGGKLLLYDRARQREACQLITIQNEKVPEKLYEYFFEITYQGFP